MTNRAFVAPTISRLRPYGAGTGRLTQHGRRRLPRDAGPSESKGLPLVA